MFFDCVKILFVENFLVDRKFPWSSNFFVENLLDCRKRSWSYYNIIRSQYFFNRQGIIWINSDSCKIMINTICDTTVFYLILSQISSYQLWPNNTKYTIITFNKSICFTEPNTKWYWTHKHFVWNVISKNIFGFFIWFLIW